MNSSISLSLSLWNIQEPGMPLDPLIHPYQYTPLVLLSTAYNATAALFLLLSTFTLFESVETTANWQRFLHK